MKAAINDELTLVFVELGEGKSGDYDPNDPNDVELLRFDTIITDQAARDYGVTGESNGDNSFVPQDCSYCTNIPVGTPRETLAYLAGSMAATLYVAMVQGASLKRAAESLSWMTERGVA